MRVSTCGVQLTSAKTYQRGAMVWPDPLPGSDWKLSFTATLSNTSPTPADGFAVVLGDPTLGATTTSLGTLGAGLGARGIPGVVFEFDTYRNLDEPAAPYFGITRGELPMWENPWQFTTSLPVLAQAGKSITHSYNFIMQRNQLTVTLDGGTIFAGQVAAPKNAFLFVTAGTGDKYEEVTIENAILQ